MNKQTLGFTLVELLVAMAIVGLLASIAYPVYQDHGRKGKRADAKAALVEAQNAMERFLTLNGTYVGAVAGTDFPSQTPTSGTANYKLSLSNLADRTYTITATPQGDQANDSCNALSINQSNIRTPTTAGCW